MTNNRIIIVCGCGRCGSSLVMRMLHAGGIAVRADNFASYESDDHLTFIDGQDQRWLEDCAGKAVKILEPPGALLPRGGRWEYDFIWLSRNAVEQARSQAKFARNVSGLRYSPDQMRRLVDSMERDNRRVPAMLKQRHRRGCRLLQMRFETILLRPREAAEQLAAFLAAYGQLDTARMASQVLKRSPDCAAHMRMEQQMVVRGEQIAAGEISPWTG